MTGLGQCDFLRKPGSVRNCFLCVKIRIGKNRVLKNGWIRRTKPEEEKHGHTAHTAAYFFAMTWDGQVRLSNEHLAMRWLGYEEAYDLIYYMDQKIALYELHEKLRRGML